MSNDTTLKQLSLFDVEIWKRVPGWDDYEVNNKGDVKSYRRRELHMLKHSSAPNGYLFVRLHRDNEYRHFRIHQLVMLVFVGERPQGFVINHLDGDRTNNHVDNLEYCTQKQNVHHAIEILGRTGGKPHIGEESTNAKLTDSAVREIRRLLAETDFSQRAIGNKFGVHTSLISAIKRGIAWKHVT